MRSIRGRGCDLFKRGFRAVAIDDSVANCKFHQIAKAGELHLVHDPVSVALDCPGRNPENWRNLLIAFASANSLMISTSLTCEVRAVDRTEIGSVQILENEPVEHRGR